MNNIKKGSLEVVCGSMFSGKTEELIRRMRRAQYARKSVITFKHKLDDRRELAYVDSHDGVRFTAVATDSPAIIRQFVTSSFEVVGIDEVQFFNADIVDLIVDLVEEGKRVIVAGLDLDFRGVPFSCMPMLMALADKVIKLKAICMCCGKDAHFSQRLVDHQPAKFNDPIVMVGAQECYEARCRDCFVIDRQAEYSSIVRVHEKKQLEL
jgi:thymidine kinase